MNFADKLLHKVKEKSSIIVGLELNFDLMTHTLLVKTSNSGSKLVIDTTLREQTNDILYY